MPENSPGPRQGLYINSGLFLVGGVILAGISAASLQSVIINTSGATTPGRKTTFVVGTSLLGMLVGLCLLWAGVRRWQRNSRERSRKRSGLWGKLADVVPSDVAPKMRATIGLLVANVSIFLLMLASGISYMAPSPKDALRWGADFGPLTFHGQSFRLLTSMFVHFGIVHLASNMLALYYVGRVAETIFGSMTFLEIYLFSGLFGGIVSLHAHPRAVSAGASGAIFGIIGALGALFAMTRGKLAAGKVAAARNSILLLLLNNLVPSALPHIDAAAHMGGLLAGALCGAIFVQFGEVPRWIRHDAAYFCGAPEIFHPKTPLKNCPTCRAPIEPDFNYCDQCRTFLPSHR